LPRRSTLTGSVEVPSSTAVDQRHADGATADPRHERRSARHTGRGFAVVVVVAAALVAAVTVAAAVGPVAIPAGTVWRIIAHHVTGLPQEVSWTATQDNVVWQLRLPRALLGALVGAGLAVVGVATQALVRNPLADPYLLGISSGAATGAVLVIITGLSVFGAPRPRLPWRRSPERC
jgi:iron complex transport system permease protein